MVAAIVNLYVAIINDGTSSQNLTKIDAKDIQMIPSNNMEYSLMAGIFVFF